MNDMQVLRSIGEWTRRIGIGRVGVVVALMVVVLGEGVLLLSAPIDSEATFRDTAAEVLGACVDAPHRPTCYERELPKLLSRISMEETFGVLRQVQQRDPAYRFCHVLAHELGGLEVAKDPGNWFDVIPRCPTDGLCSNGCVHGAAVARFSTEVLSDAEVEEVIPDLARACEAREGYAPTPLDQAMCYHGIGHMNVHITKSRITKSLEICDRVSVKDDGRDFTRLCDEGVFMQLFQPLEPEDFALIDELAVPPSRENLSSFCAAHGRTTDEEAACWREGWPFYREEINTPEGIVAFCSASPTVTATDRCYETVLSIVGRTSLDDGSARRICAGLPGERQGLCYSISAGAILEEDRTRTAEAARFCDEVPSRENQRTCYDRLVGIATFVFHPTDAQLPLLCEALPSPYRDRCDAQVRL